MKKYKVGKQIKSFNQLMKQEFIYVKYLHHFRILHKGWFQNYQFRLIVRYLNYGKLYKAVPTKEYRKELRVGRKIVDRLIEIPNRLPF